MRIQLITGISGSGKSVALRAYEDAGYDCIDNLPVSLIEQLVATLESENCKQIAIAIDARPVSLFHKYQPSCKNYARTMRLISFS